VQRRREAARGAARDDDLGGRRDAEARDGVGERRVQVGRAAEEEVQRRIRSRTLKKLQKGRARAFFKSPHALSYPVA
jgi:hypothetical protein